MRLSAQKHRPPRWAQWLLGQWGQGLNRHSVVADFDDTFMEMVEREGLARARTWYWWDTLRTLPVFLQLKGRGHAMMIKNYATMVMRNFRREKLFSIINVLGLAIGLATCMLIGLWVQRETGVDRFHRLGKRIYRVERQLFRDDAYSRWPIVGGQYKDALIADVPEIENAVRIMNRTYTLKTPEGQVHRQRVSATDNALFDLFDFHLRAGDEKTALSAPNSVVLTAALAKKFFGRSEVVGEVLQWEYDGENRPLKVTGILEAIPDNSTLQFEMLLSMSSFPDESFSSWRSNYLYTYVLLSKQTDLSIVNEKLKTFVETHLAAHYGDLTVQGLDIHEVLKLYLYPFHDIYLHPAENWELVTGGSAQTVMIFTSVALLILLTACVNFINLSTARAHHRAKEVCLRKTVGAARHQLRGQFIQESIALAFMGWALAVLICLLLAPLYTHVFGDTLQLRVLFQPKYFIAMLGVTVVAGCGAGLYPAYYLTRFEPADLGRGQRNRGAAGFHFRRNLVVLQFTVAAVLMIGLFTVYTQMRYIQSRPLGFNPNRMLLLSARSQQVAEGYEAFKTALLADSRVEALTRSMDVPGADFYSNTGFNSRSADTDPANMLVLGTGFNFADVYEIPLLAGRYFSKEHGADVNGTLILNAAGARRFGWSPEEAVGKELTRGGGRWFRIVGVVEDFHLKSLRQEVEPLVFLLFPQRFRTLSVRLGTGDTEETMAVVRKTWEETFPGVRFEYSFLSDQLARLYAKEQNMQKIFIVFCTFSVLVACLGLLGLAAFTAERRSKEVGIRIVLGSSTRAVMRLLTGEFLRWVIIANITAAPVAWWLMQRWLQGFAYRMTLGAVPFIAATAISLGIALLTITVQVIKVVRRNPIEVLRLD